MCAQELQIEGSDLDDFGRWASKNGWDAFLEGAEKGAGGGLSGGVAILCRRGAAAIAQGVTLTSSRAVSAAISFGSSPAITVCSVCLVTGGRLCDHNKKILANIGEDVQSRGRSFIIAGDFNVQPDVLAEAGFSARIGADLLCPSSTLGTCVIGVNGCDSSVIDFFVVSHGLASTVEGVQCDPHWPANPHRPVKLTIMHAFETVQVLRFSPRAAIPSVAPVGPRRRPPSWAAPGAGAAAASAVANCHGNPDASIGAALSAAYALFAVTAACELGSTTGVDLPRARAAEFGLPPKLQWVDALSLDKAVVTNDADREARGSRVVAQLLGQLCGAARASGRVAWERRRRQIGSAARAAAACHAGLSTALDQRFGGLRCLVYEGEGEGRVSEALRAKIQQQCDAAHACAATAVATARACRTQSWRTWVDTATKGGASGGHAYVRGSEWRPPSVRRGPAGIETGRHDEILAYYKDSWSAHWVVPRCANHDAEISTLLADYPCRQPLPAISPEEIRAASRTFKRNTSRSADGFHVRHFALLSDEALRCAATIWGAIEASGVYPSQIARAIIPLIPKKAGSGLRPIGSLAALYRVAMRCRREHIRLWESSISRP